MTTLHDLLNDGRPRREEKQTPRVDLGRRYSKIGLSAVAAAAPYRSAVEDCKKDHAEDRLAARAWSQRQS